MCKHIKSVDEFNKLVSHIIKSYQENIVNISSPESFYYNGIKYDKDTPDELWDLLPKKLLNKEIKMKKGEISIDLISVTLFIVLGIIFFIGYNYLNNKISELAKASDLKWVSYTVDDHFEKQSTHWYLTSGQEIK